MVVATESLAPRLGARLSPDQVAKRLRSATGLILFAYVLTHLVNAALGVVSLQVQEAGRDAFILFWRNPIGSAALYGSLVIHIGLAFRALYRRRSLRMPPWEAAQLLLGLAIPPLLVEHNLGTRLASALFGLQDHYFYVDFVLWKVAPLEGLRQSVALIVAWLHGCIGLHFWLRIRPWYPRALPYFYAAALLVPILALLGAAKAGQETVAIAQDPAAFRAELAQLHLPTAAEAALIYRLEYRFLALFAAALLGVLLARWVRAALERRRGLVRVSYPGGRVVEAPPGATLLEISRAAGIPHASVCGGRGRCSTCRVRVSTGLENQPPASEDEQRLLQRIGAPANVRLACQLRPRGTIAMTPLLPPSATARDAGGKARHAAGEELMIAILFADLRAFTRFAERRLPYDVVFVLNRYFSAMGLAIEQAGGRVDKFIGDGVMALFGIDEGPEAGCRQALAAARAMAQQLVELNHALAHELREPLRIGIGIHVGPAIVGEMGYARATTLTAIGDAVNTASRLEAVTKDYQAQLVISETVAQRAGLASEAYPRHEIAVRGRQEPLAILVIEDALTLPELLRAQHPPRGAAAARA
jgi:adenylate cyclase